MTGIPILVVVRAAGVEALCPICGRPYRWCPHHDRQIDGAATGTSPC